ncbi:hypothetical protein [Collinsella tanakaei]|uniref:hypothetical protein n=1 Tax=Collinsella tanakaei TaxID=626935 RepID=UPI002658152B|nr:hypothetical protein [Collinsella tanakaei]
MQIPATNAIKPAARFHADRFIKLSFHDEWDYAQFSYSFNGSSVVSVGEIPA